MEIRNVNATATTTTYYYFYTDYSFEGEYFNVGIQTYDAMYLCVQILSIIGYSITILLGLVGNGLVIWISGFKVKTVSTVWFLNLAIVDFISCIFLIFRVLQRILGFHSEYYLSLCSISMTALFTNMVTSVHFLILISLDRCVSIMWPFWAKVHRTKKLACSLSGFMWLLNIMIFTLQMCLYIDIFTVSECVLRYTRHKISYKVAENVILIVRNICVFAVPFLTIFVSYGLIASKLRTVRRRRSHRPFMIIAAILISFFVCWFPYHTWTLVSLRYHNWRIDLVMTEISTILASFNCAINPILYVFLGKGFKKNFLRSMPKRVEIILSDPGDFNERNDEKNVNDTSV
ncbi:N-formyl peptide receptor 3-like [Leptodactylus fuscus]|uniref:N-formyl peptide receptor 3-like n=1 Tax=Leptodactylus fuscus TaxID=238119 RepID=UPI003F4E4613